ncbi:MAG TPA: RNA-binding S4 domain-containing protein [Planctomycetota bacterium]|nr:RNA-binding S4 domain-containing protein [Planctomycetota bacterium]
MSDRDTSSERVIRLDQFLKLVGAMRTGGEAKHAIQSGEVEVNGEVDTRRSRKLREGDTVDCRGSHWVVTKEALDELEPGEEIA